MQHPIRPYIWLPINGKVLQLACQCWALDTAVGELHLSADKLEQLQELLQQWGDIHLYTQGAGILNKPAQSYL